MVDEKLIQHTLGEKGLRQLTQFFYQRIIKDDLIGPMYPQYDMQGSEERLADFLCMRFCANQTYLKKRGHPRLRQRHLPFKIGVKERDRWLELMQQSINELDVSTAVNDSLMAFFSQVADFMRNQDEQQ